MCFTQVVARDETYSGHMADITPMTLITKVYCNLTTKYGPQTKILEDGTKDEMRTFDWLFNGS